MPAAGVGGEEVADDLDAERLDGVVGHPLPAGIGPRGERAARAARSGTARRRGARSSHPALHARARATPSSRTRPRTPGARRPSVATPSRAGSRAGTSTAGRGRRRSPTRPARGRGSSPGRAARTADRRVLTEVEEDVQHGPSLLNPRDPPSADGPRSGWASSRIPGRSPPRNRSRPDGGSSS